MSTASVAAAVAVAQFGPVADRDANLVKTNDKGVTVNRWNTTGILCSSAASNESGYLTVKVARGLGMVAIDTQARI